MSDAISRLNEVVITGPVGVGKTTVSALLAEALGVPHVELDSLRFGYYAELGYDEAVRERLSDAEGWPAVYRYWKVFDPHSVERILEEHSGVIDMGGGSLICEYDDQLDRMRRALAPFPNVVMLTPCEDVDQALGILDKQKGRPMPGNRHFLEHHSLWELARIVVYTADHTPEEVRDEILQRLVPMPFPGKRG
jgi:shikimate kinase